MVRPSAAASSIWLSRAVGLSGCFLVERAPRMHMSADRIKEKLRLLGHLRDLRYKYLFICLHVIYTKWMTALTFQVRVVGERLGSPTPETQKGLWPFGCFMLIISEDLVFYLYTSFYKTVSNQPFTQCSSLYASSHTHVTGRSHSPNDFPTLPPSDSLAFSLLSSPQSATNAHTQMSIKWSMSTSASNI